MGGRDPRTWTSTCCLWKCAVARSLNQRQSQYSNPGSPYRRGLPNSTTLPASKFWHYPMKRELLRERDQRVHTAGSFMSSRVAYSHHFSFFPEHYLTEFISSRSLTRLWGKSRGQRLRREAEDKREGSVRCVLWQPTVTSSHPSSDKAVAIWTESQYETKCKFQHSVALWKPNSLY